MSNVKVVSAFPGARVVDSYPFSLGGTAEQARKLFESGVEGLVAYLGNINLERVNFALDAGLAFMPVTKAGAYENGAQDEVDQLHALGIPAGASVWLDLEGLKAYRDDPVALMAKLTGWANLIAQNGWMPCLYVGAPQPLTAKELYSLPFVRYWLGIGHCVDRFNADAYPACGWAMRQDWHNNPDVAKGVNGGMLWKNTGIIVDPNQVQCDHKGRLPAWIMRA